MRESPTKPTERLGVLAVSAAFVKLDWGPSENHAHDFGTDLFVFVRDERLDDHGLLLAAQVKAGASRFSRPRRVDDEPIGWWYRERHRRHFDYWTSHVVPHVLVLHDLTTDTSYWVHVTGDAVQPAGAGAKIFVPRANTIDTAHRDALMRVASTARAPVALEGTAWTGGASIKPRDQLRSALLVPRLIAPHPNGFVEQLTAPQAIAMLVQARLQELARYAEQLVDVPTLDEAGAATSWAWRWFGALGRWVTRDDDGALRDCCADAPDPAARSAAAVALASALIGVGNPDDALAVLDEVLATDDLWPVDDAWLRVQRARALLETGAVREAHREAGAVQAIRVHAPDDLTATALQGVAAGVLFGTGAWAGLKIDAVVEGADRVANWWRQETTSRGARATIDRLFKAWARDTTTTIIAADEANNQLYAAALSAGLIGDQGTWRQLSGVLGRDGMIRLDRCSDPDRVVDAVETLRLAGDAKALGRAVQRLADDGPAIAIRSAAAAVDLARATRTTIAADLALVSQAGDLFDAETAARAVDWLGHTLDTPDALAAVDTLLRSGGRPQLPLIKALAGVATTLPERVLALAHQQLAAMTGPAGEAFAAWGRVLQTIPDPAWTEEAVETTWQLPVVQSSALRWPLLARRAVFDDTARTLLVDAVRAGRLIALRHLATVVPLSDLEPAVAHAVVPRLLEQLASISAEARDGRASTGRGDPARDLAHIVGDHPDRPVLDVLLEFLDDPLIARRFKGDAFVVLAHHIAAIPGDLRRPLLELAERVRDLPSELDDPTFDPDVAGQVGFLAGRLDPTSTPVRVAALARGPLRQRKWAAHLAATDPSSTAALLTFSADDHPVVRAAAAAAAIGLLATDPTHRLAEVVVRQAAGDPGRLPALAVAEARIADVRDALSSHVSADVRARAAATASP